MTVRNSDKESMNAKLRFLKTNSNKIIKIRTRSELTFTIKNYQIIDGLILFDDDISGRCIALDPDEIMMLTSIEKYEGGRKDD